MSATIHDRESGLVSNVRSTFLVGADGPRSEVRERLGIRMDGPDDLGRYLSLLFRADLSDVLGATRYGLYLVGEPGPGRPPTVVVPSGADDRYVMGVALPPGIDDAAVAQAFPLDRCLALIREAAGRPDLDVELLATSVFAFAAQVATSWRVGRAFLVGDAAHRMTPRGGRGMNTAIADGHDLGWKLAWVVRGLADPALLDTYEAERGPIGRRNVEMSMTEGGGGSADGLLEDLGPLDAQPGQRAPHAWLTDAGRRVSTLDLFGEGFVLLASGQGSSWTTAAGTLGDAVPLRAHAIDDTSFAAVHRPRARRCSPRPPRRDRRVAVRSRGRRCDRRPPGRHRHRDRTARGCPRGLDDGRGMMRRRRLASIAGAAWEALAMLALAWGGPFRP